MIWSLQQIDAQKDIWKRKEHSTHWGKMLFLLMDMESGFLLSLHSTGGQTRDNTSL